MIIFFNNLLACEKSRSKPFAFNFPLNFAQKESLEVITVYFDQTKVKNKIEIEDF